ncbi:MAG: DNA polymerase I [Gammaproteobacteria bacterium]|nr:DNA polymerase I [Gammaproteobacteria bacterium]MCH9763609.1 DNA polymerase I [Gammaproteobacteria bacterium]
MKKAPFVLVDGSSYFFRAFHALPPLTNSEGHPTGAVYGVVNMIRRLLKDTSPSQFAIVFDAPGKTFRHDLYPEYKANRPPMPDDLRRQFKPLIEILKALGFPLLIVDDVEADDVIGTLAVQAAAANHAVLISTGDKDMAQLVNSHVTLINTMSRQVLDPEGVLTKFGVRPDQIIDYLALVGDTSDNVPGVPQCGPKTAVKWLALHHTLDNLMTHADTIGGKIGERLRESLPMLPLSKRLVTIKTDVTLPQSLDDLKPSPPNRDVLLSLARELEVNVWLKEWGSAAATQTPSPAPALPTENQSIAFDMIQDNAALDAWIDHLKHATHCCIDTETTDLDPLKASLVGIALAVDSTRAAYIPLAHTNCTPQLSQEHVLAALKPYLESHQLKKIGQNLKYDYAVLKQYNITLNAICFDTMLEAYVLNSTAGRHNLDALAMRYLNHQTIHFEDVVGRGKKAIPFADVPIEKAAPYAAEDALIAYKLHETLYPKLDTKLQSVLEQIEMPLVPILADIESHGVLLDIQQLEAHGTQLSARIHALAEKAYTLATKTFNLNSPKQLQEILYDTLNLPILSKTPKGQPSTAESVLQELAFDYPLPAIILEYRSLTKLMSTYIEALPKRVNVQTGRIHTSYNQAVTATGRLSSSNPNLQNIPVRHEEGRRIRQAFIAPEGCLLLASDYSQIELRIMAHLSGDAGLKRAFDNDWDIHAATASEIFSTPLEEITAEQRRRAKAINFGLIYGMSSFGLAKQLSVSREDAKAYIKRYFERYPGVFDYMEATREQAHEQGYVETLFGRRLYLPEINASNKMRQKAAERTAINAPMQGTAADIIKKAMCSVANWQTTPAGQSARMIMQVHDELVFEVQADAIQAAELAIKKHMEQAAVLNVPLRVSIDIGTNWDAAH